MAARSIASVTLSFGLVSARTKAMLPRIRTRTVN
ncbi:hypothetical protein AWB74_05985 [Caballeronia arvi]|uniref:Uncharacterized protein n=1 Tax=Caballeronia arvi TaxID=1777135 RepID=A0A158KLY1_9BURK|nr:hypothetical protein AWB74_05985 [Caballeronia arvi]